MLSQMYEWGHNMLSIICLILLFIAENSHEIRFHAHKIVKEGSLGSALATLPNPFFAVLSVTRTKSCQ